MESEIIILGVCLVAMAGLAYYLYTQNLSLDANVKALALAKADLEKTLSSTKDENLKALADKDKTIALRDSTIVTKDTIINETKTLFDAYRSTNEALIADMKKPPAVIASTIALMQQSADVIADAIITYHISTKRNPELVDILKYYYNGLKAMYRQQDSMYDSVKNNVFKMIAADRGTFVSNFTQTCNNLDRMADDLFSELVGYVGTCTATTCTTSPIVPFKIPQNPIYAPATTSATYTSMGSFLQIMGFNPYTGTDGMMAVAGVVTFVNTIKQIMKKYCSMPLNSANVDTIVLKAMDEIYNQIIYFRKMAFLSVYNFVGMSVAS